MCEDRAAIHRRHVIADLRCQLGNCCRSVQGAASGLHMVAAFEQAGFPPGLLQAVTGKGSEIGDYLTTHTHVDCISFTGGDTGVAISKKAGMVPLQMELGGKDVCLVCADADLALAAKSIIKGGLSYQGQRCTAVKVFHSRLRYCVSAGCSAVA